MASVLRYKVFSALRNASRSCSFIKPQSLTNVRFTATVAQRNALKRYHEMSIHQCLLIVENKINTRGRLTGFELDCIVQAVQNKGDLKSNQVLLLVRCCGSVAANEKPEVRMAYAEKVWNAVKASGVDLDISHYNAYLKVQMENEVPIEPFEYLQAIKDKGLTPNRVTYQYLITYCCHNGDLGGATELLEIMKSKNYLLNESIFNALVMGHCVVGDISGAEGVMNIMREKELFVTSKTYSMFLCGLAHSGNIEKMRSVMEECAKNSIDIRGSRLMDVIYYLFINGHNDYAEELLKNVGEINNFRDVISLQYRLLHKKQFDGYLETLKLMSREEDMVDKMRLALRYLGNKEDFETILKFKEAVDRKGLNVDVMKIILYYSLTSKNIERCYGILDYLHKSGEQIKRTYFAPLLMDASKKGNLDVLFQVVNTMTYTYACEVNSGFLTANIFDHLKLNERQMNYLVGGLTVHVPRGVVLHACITSALKKRDLEPLLGLSDSFRIPAKIFESTLNQFMEHLRDGLSVAFVGSIVSKWIRSQKHETNQKSSEPENSQAQSIVVKDIEKMVNNLAIKMFRECGKSFAEDFLKIAERESFPISAEVVDIIRKNSEAESLVFPGEETSGEESADAGEPSKSEEFSETYDEEKKDSVFIEFSKLRSLENLSEMENLFNEHEKLQTPYGFKKMVEVLKIMEKHDEILEYLRKYYEKYSQEEKIYNKNLFLEAEMINRGMLEEAVALIDKRGHLSRSSCRVITEMFVPIFERGDPNELKKLINIQYSKQNLFNLQDIVDNMVNRGSEVNLFKSLEILDERDISNIDFNKSLIPALYNKKNFKYMEKLIEIIEKHGALRKSVSELIFLYACTGNIAKGRELLDSNPVNALQWVKNLSAVNESNRMRLLENAIAISKGYESFQKTKIYDNLIVIYQMNFVNPDKAFDLWLQLQEENVQPSPSFLHTLAEILKKNGREVPFSLPPKMVSNTIFVPQTFSMDIKSAIWSIKGKASLVTAASKLQTLLLENRLDEYHISKIQSFNPDMDPDIKRMLTNISSCIEWKKAYERGLLVDHTKKFIDNAKSPENSYRNIPVKFLLHLLVSPSVRSTYTVSHVILWAYLRSCPEYSSIAEKVEPQALGFIKINKTLNALVDVIEEQSSIPKMKKIITFLLQQNVFDENSVLRQRVEQALNPIDDKVERNNISYKDEEEKEDDFSFKNVLESQTEVQATIGSQNSEKLESADTVETEKRTSGSGSNL